MASILMVNIPYAGHTNPTLYLARELVKRGHTVQYVNAPEYADAIRATGATFVPYIHYPDNPRPQQKKMRCFRAAYDTALSIQNKFDLFIYEMFFYPGLRIAERLQIPCVRQFSQPAWDASMIDRATPFFRLSCKLIDAQVMGKRNVAYMGLAHKRMTDAVLYDQPNLNLVYVPEVFQPCRDSFDESYIFAAPPFHVPDTQSDIPYGDMKRPILYISLGSIISNRGFCKACIRAFAHTRFSVILNTGKVEPASLGKLPDNIRAYAFVPQIEVLQNADVFLTHCGMNSVNEAISMGVPMIAMPFINDQISNARRITEMGLGVRVRSFPTSAKALYAAVERVSRDAEIKDNCLRARRALDPNCFYAAVDRVEALL
ncbi:MAG: glycosyltransferase [Eubacteriales bacterium]|nr:glycosyltransferase [Eubacteriales bacterium]